MKKLIKWLLILFGGLFVLIVAALLIIPMFVDVQGYRSEIEKRATEATGRPVTLGGELSLSLFPWAGLAFSDLHLGNPPGFKEKDFISVRSFELRLKLLPLISRDIQVKRFIVEGPRLVLEKRKDGKGNWEDIGKASGEASTKGAKTVGEKSRAGLPIKTLAIGEFAVREGAVIYIDQTKETTREISNLSLQLDDVSLDRSIPLTISAEIDGKPISIEGNIGPLGADPGKGSMPLDIIIKALNQLDVHLKGKIMDAASDLRFDLALEISPFSPRKLMDALGQAFPMKTTDPGALNLVALKATLKGDSKAVSIPEGSLELDQSKIAFVLGVKDFAGPDVDFNIHLDSIDLDRYIPPGDEKKPGKKETAVAAEGKKTDYTPLRKLVLNGTIAAGKIKARGVNIRDLKCKLTGKNGIFHIDPLDLKLYEGGMSVKGSVDVRKDVPRSRAEIQAKGIQVGPLLRDFLKKDFLEGRARASVTVRMEGDDAKRIKSTLNGKGQLLFTDGAVVGIDLAGMLRNVKAAFGLSKKAAQRPRTDFSELRAPFTITNGVVKTPGTSLMSPLVRVLAAGKADLVREDIDFRVEPKFVATIKGQGDKMDRSGITIPVLVTGTFSSPKFRPDLKSMITQGLTDPSKIKDMAKELQKGKSVPKSIEKKLKGILKGLPFKK